MTEYEVHGRRYLDPEDCPENFERLCEFIDVEPDPYGYALTELVDDNGKHATTVHLEDAMWWETSVMVDGWPDDWPFPLK